MSNIVLLLKKKIYSIFCYLKRQITEQF